MRPTKNKPGRPRLDPAADTARVGVSLPVPQYDAYVKRALADGVSVPEIIRRDLEKKSTK